MQDIKIFGSTMNSSKQFIYMYLFAISLVCNAADKKLIDYKSVSFNSQIVKQLNSLLYRTDKDFIIAGNTGFEIQRSDYIKHNSYKKSPGSWNLLKDAKKIVAFNEKGIIITKLHIKPELKNRSGVAIQSYQDDEITISMKQENIKCIALDSDKNTIFIGYNCLSCNSGIRQYCYDSHSYKNFELDHKVQCVSIDLSPKKDILCLLDSHDTISFRKTDSLASVFKKTRLSLLDIYLSCRFSPDGLTLAVDGEQSIHIIDGYAEQNEFGSISEELEFYALSDVERIKAIAFHPCGLLAALISNGFNSSLIKYWNTRTMQAIDTTTLPGIRGRNFCFSDDGLEVAMISNRDCIRGPISPQVIRQYILLPLWMKLKQMQATGNIPQDILVHCMNVFTAYCSK